MNETVRDPLSLTKTELLYCSPSPFSLYQLHKLKANKYFPDSDPHRSCLFYEACWVLTQGSHLSSLQESQWGAEPSGAHCTCGLRCLFCRFSRQGWKWYCKWKIPSSAQVKYKDRVEKSLLGWVIYCIICTGTGNKPSCTEVSDKQITVNCSL